MKIAIIGAGAVGSYYGARLAQAGEDVTFLLRSDFATVKKHGLKIESIHGDFNLPKVQCTDNSNTIGTVDLVILTWKTTSNHFAKSVITPLLKHNTKILTLQNGIGNVEFLAKLFGIERILAGLCFVCINRTAPGKIKHTAAGLVRIANANSPVDTYLKNITNSWQQANIECESIDSLEKALWTKLIWNFPFNGLAIAEGGVDTETLLSPEKKIEPQIRSIMQEVITVGQALGHDIPFSLIDKQIDITKKMGAYKPSSMIDYINQRPVELQSIWEKPLSVAENLKINTPNMLKLTKRIREKLNTST